MEKVIYSLDHQIDKSKDEIIKLLKEIISIQEKQIELLKEEADKNA